MDLSEESRTEWNKFRGLEPLDSDSFSPEHPDDVLKDRNMLSHPGPDALSEESDALSEKSDALSEESDALSEESDALSEGP